MAVSFPTFYGHHDENARDFMDSLEMAHLMAGRDQEEVKLRAFPLVLKGEARVWYDALAPPSKATWPTLYGAFLNKYDQGDTPENLWKQLLQHRQGSLGDYNTYESKFTNLWERWAASLQGQGGAPNFLKRDKFVEGTSSIAASIRQLRLLRCDNLQSLCTKPPLSTLGLCQEPKHHMQGSEHADSGND
ncbi:hypothetical protein L7F22_035846 [Adiantum nelumboides]|nr:hypothetical protein [Adiantum nelumboides]